MNDVSSLLCLADLASNLGDVCFLYIYIKEMLLQKSNLERVIFQIDVFKGKVPIPMSEGRKEGNVLFNDAFNTFYLRLYGVRHMVKDNSDIEKGNSLPPHRLLFPINSKGSFIFTIPQTG